MALTTAKAMAIPIIKKIKGEKSSKSCPEYARLDATSPSGNWMSVNILQKKARRRKWCYFTRAATHPTLPPTAGNNLNFLDPRDNPGHDDEQHDRTDDKSDRNQEVRQQIPSVSERGRDESFR